MATYDNIEELIRTENGRHDSVDDQIIVARWFWNHDITVVDDRVARTRQVEEAVEHRLEHQVRTSLDNLENVGVLTQFDPPGSGRYIRHHRTGENFYDPSTREFIPLLEEEISRFLDDLASRPPKQSQVADGGHDADNEEDTADVEKTETLRGVAAEVLDVDESEVERALTAPADAIERMNRLDAVVTAVKDSEEVTRKRDYDEMGWRNSALRWSLSARAAHMEGNHSLST